MGDYYAEQSAVTEDCYTIYKRPQQNPLSYSSYGYGSQLSYLTTRTRMVTLCGQTEESIKKILKKYECPTIVTVEDGCSGQ